MERANILGREDREDEIRNSGKGDKKGEERETS